LARDEIRRSLEIQPQGALSHADELKLVAHVGGPAYRADVPALAGPKLSPRESLAQRGAAEQAQSRIPSPRKLGDVSGFRVLASDAEVGSVGDCILGTEDWVIRSLIVQTTDTARSVLVPPDWMERADWERGQFAFDVTRSAIETSPVLSGEAVPDRPYEASLYDHFERPKYWARSQGGQQQST